MKKTTLKLWTILLSLCAFAGVNAADLDFPLGQSDINLISNGGLVSYDGATQTITFAAGSTWQYAGHQWAAGDYADLSAYNYVMVEFDASGLENPTPADPTKIQVQVTYSDGTNSQAEVRLTNSIAAVSLNAAKSAEVKEIFIKSQWAGTIVLSSIYATNITDSDMPLFEISNFDNGAYDIATKTLSVVSDWGRASWVNLTKDVSGYETFVVEFDPATLDPSDAWLQAITRVDGVDLENSEVDRVNGKIVVNLTGTTLTEIHLKLNKPGSVVLIKAYFTSPIVLDDLIKNPVGKLGYAGAFTTYPINNEFTLAVDLTGTNLAAWLAEETIENRGVAIQIWHGDISNTQAEYLRLDAPITGNIWGDAVTLSDMFSANLPVFEEGDTQDFYVVAFGFIYGTDLNDVNYDTDWYLSPTDLFGSDSEPLVTTGTNIPKADDATVAGYYSIMGAKLSAEPASGVFIVKYANGKAIKVVK